MEKQRLLTILYGTQTGCAKEVAERIGREGKRRHFRTKVISLDEYSFVSGILYQIFELIIQSELPTENLVIFAVSTTGQGEIPDNMKVRHIQVVLVSRPFGGYFYKKKLHQMH